MPMHQRRGYGEDERWDMILEQADQPLDRHAETVRDPVEEPFIVRRQPVDEDLGPFADGDLVVGDQLLQPI